MLDLVESLSLESGAVVVAVASGLVAVILAQLRPAKLRWVLALGAPLILSYSLYWSPAWLGADPFALRVWAPLFILPWFLAGVLASSVVVFVATRRMGHGGHDG